MNRFLLKLILVLKGASKKVRKNLSINSFQGRTLLLLIFFVSALTSLSSFTIYYNGRVTNINRQIIELRRPSTLYTSKILIGMNRAATMQNGYFLTQTESFRQERRKVWEREIIPSIDTLASLDKRFVIEEVNIGDLKRLLENYEKMQIDLENYFIENSDPTSDYFERSSNDSRYEVVNDYIKQYNLEKLIPTQEQLIVVLTTLSERQESLLQQDIEQIQKEITRFNLIVYSLIIICVILAVFLGISVITTIRNSIKNPTEQIALLAQGNLPDEVPRINNEMKEIVVAGNQLANHLRNASQFASEIGNGNFNYEFTPASENDRLGNALIQMRKQLMEIAEEDTRQNWVTEGLAKFVDILRNTDVDFESLADDIIAQIVRYVSVQQGTLFTITSQSGKETILQQSSYYAYDRKKFLNDKIVIYEDYAEGLIGQSFIEATTIYLTEVPNNYLKINSGLGELQPKCILIVPLKFNEKVEGVIELASLKELESFEIEFVEELAENIAATIYNFRNNERTKTLLQESQEQGEEMRAQEEEMRQNVEELAATQEEMRRKSNELERLLSESKLKEDQLNAERRESTHINQMLQSILDGNDAAIYVTDLQGSFLMVSERFLSIFNKTRKEVVGRTNEDIMEAELAKIFTKKNREAFSGKMNANETHSILGKSITFNSARFPLINSLGKTYAICGILSSVEGN